MSGYIGNTPIPQATQTRDSFTATSSQTSFATGGYTPNFLDVFLNGLKLNSSQFTATNGTDVVLTSAASSGDIVEVIAYTAFEVADASFDELSIGGDLTVGGTVDGRDIAADGTKLDGIESGATGDQTNAEIRAAVEAATDSNVFTDADHTKLNAIEASATADQTAAEIRTLVESATDSNVFTDADHTKLNAIEANATADQTKSDIEGLGIDVPANNLTGTIPAARLSTATTQAESDDSTKIATTAYVVDKITTLIGGAPSTLNDLNELAAAINDDANYNSTLTTALGTKLPKSGGTMTGNLSFGDNDKAIFGAGSDLWIYSDGTDSYIEERNGTGSLYIDATDLQLRSTANAKYFRGITGGAVDLYYNNASKLATTSTGINVTGTVTSDGLTVDGTTQVDNYGSTSGKGRIQFGNSGQKFIEGFDTGNAGSGSYLKFGSGSTTQMTLDNSGNLLMGTTDDAPANNSSGSTADDGFAIKSDGNFQVAKYNGTPAYINRTGNDGTLIDLRKNGATVGGIGTYTQDLNSNFYIGFDRGSSDVGLGFGHSAGTGRAYYPCRVNGSGVTDAISIGTSTYKYKDLYLSGSIANPSGNITLDASGDIILDADGEDILFKDGGLEIGRFSNSGSGNLSIKSSVADKDIIFKGNDGGSTITALTLDMSEGGSARFNRSVSGYNGSASLPSFCFDSDPNTGIFRPASDNLGFAIGGVQRAFMSATQFNVNTKIVATELDINGNADISGKLTITDSTNYEGIHLNGNNAPCITFVKGTTSTPTWRAGISGYDGAAFAISTGTSVGDRLHIKSDGKIGIGTTSPSAPLHINSDSEHQLKVTASASAGASMQLQSAGGYAYQVFTNSSKTWRMGAYGGSSFTLLNHSDSVTALTVTSSGNVTASGNITANSDISLKDNITPIPDALDKVLQIRGVTFNRNDIEDNPRHAGVIAQEVEKVLPEVVSEGKDGIKSVAYGNMVGLLIEAIKEQQEQINMLKEQLESK